MLFSLILISSTFGVGSSFTSSTNAGFGYTYEECVDEGNRQVNGYYLPNPKAIPETKTFRYGPGGTERDLTVKTENTKYIHVPGKFSDYSCVKQPEQKGH